MSVELHDVISDFAAAFKAVDTERPIGRSRKRQYRPGVGPLSEEEAITRALSYLRGRKPQLYEHAGPKVYPHKRQKCDLVIPNQWAIEFKLIRPFGDNEVEGEHWSENILHPYPGNVSSLGDAIKLLDSEFQERKAVAVFGFEHVPAKINLDVAIKCFETIAREVLSIQLGARCYGEFTELIHPCHTHGRIWGWEVLPRASN